MSNSTAYEGQVGFDGSEVRLETPGRGLEADGVWRDLTTGEETAATKPELREARRLYAVHRDIAAGRPDWSREPTGAEDFDPFDPWPDDEPYLEQVDE
jgi:hypothetical protein